LLLFSGIGMLLDLNFVVVERNRWFGRHRPLATPVLLGLHMLFVRALRREVNQSFGS
jgi:hypothetical protein